jgi:NADH-quinone oxidoreductase subunit L
MTKLLWLVPALPLAAAGLTALSRRRHRRRAAALAIGSMAAALLLSVVAFLMTLARAGSVEVHRWVHTCPWFQIGDTTLPLGMVLDPLAAVMLVMVSLVGLLIFVYSAGYMARDDNFTRFFCFMSLFAAAMLGLVLADSLLGLFVCWELVGLASYLLIGFWYEKPSAAAAAKKAFLVTRLGDLGLFLGMLWLYKETGTLLFYDEGRGCLEPGALAGLAGQTTWGGLAVSTAVSLLIFCGAIGKSGQVPLHVWLPDAMEGPTPVSALIHAATMVAAGVFLVARVYPLMALTATPLEVVTWVGAITALVAACIAVAQTDIKRILAYSTVSQLGYMMMGLGVGGVAVGMFHLITHAFFKALLFLGAGSVIHGCQEEQDIRRLGGLRRLMPVTFATYAVGMMALCGVPLFFSGFWSKDAILHAAQRWPVSRGPFILGLLGALLTAFYMTRQMCYVFFGERRTGFQPVPQGDPQLKAHEGQAGSLYYVTQESPRVMTVPLIILAAFAVALGFLGTPIWPWFHHCLEGGLARFDLHAVGEAVPLMLLSTLLVAAGVAMAWRLYRGRAEGDVSAADALEKRVPRVFCALQRGFFVDDLYAATVVKLFVVAAALCEFFDRWVWGGAVRLVAGLTTALSWLGRLADEHLVNGGFDFGCRRLLRGGRALSALQDGQVQHYLAVIGLALTALVFWLSWGGGK